MADGQAVTRHLTVGEKCYCLLSYVTAQSLLHGSEDLVVLGIVGPQGSAPAVHFLLLCDYLVYVF